MVHDINEKEKYYIGISALHHDSTAALIDHNGNIISISQEERRTKKKNDKSWPDNSIKFLHNQAVINGDGYRRIHYGYYEQPWLKFLRRIQTNPKKIFEYYTEAKEPKKSIPAIKYYHHHKSHALAACATAPFQNGVYLIVDAIGEYNSTTWGTFDHNKGVVQDGQINYPYSLGLLYSAFTRWLGFTPNEEEFIVMGASAYGKPKFSQEIFDKFIKLTPSGYKLKKDVHNGIEKYLGYEIPTKDWMNWAASIQDVCEIVMDHLVKNLEEQYGKDLNLVLGGGVALNCVVNSKLLENRSIQNIWILPSPGDGGNALGAAAHVAKLSKLNWTTPFLGKTIDPYEPTHALIQDVVHRLEQGQIVGWIQGAEEFGPRAFGHRSLLADPRNPDMKDKVNEIKKRQEFRPFAPAVLEENAFSYFDMPGKPENHRYMQFVSRVRNPESLPAICHIDNTSRVQTVPKSDDPFRKLLEHWHHVTDCAVLLNTSLNIKGQPLISERNEAIKMLMNTSMDALVIGGTVYSKIEKAGLDDGQDFIVDSITYR